jgi:hypothetical protein
MRKVFILFTLLLIASNVNSQCNPPAQEICLVTADTILHRYGVIVWEKVVTDEIDSFFIYRKNAFSLYDKIGATHYSDPGEFMDTGIDLADNILGLYKYKISTLDTCGNESPKSNFHKPIHLGYSGTGNFNYDDYEVEGSSSNYPFELYMDITGVGNSWQLINSVGPGNYTMNDAGFASNPSAVYHVRAILPNSCDPTRTGVNTSRSNIKNQTITNEITERENDKLFIYPNPASAVLNIQLWDAMEVEMIEIINILGETVHSSISNLLSIDLTGLDKGVYLVKVTTNRGNHSQRFVKD